MPLVDLTNRVVAPAVLGQAQVAVQFQMKPWSYYKMQAQMVFPAIASSVRTQSERTISAPSFWDENLFPVGGFH